MTGCEGGDGRTSIAIGGHLRSTVSLPTGLLITLTLIEITDNWLIRKFNASISTRHKFLLVKNT